MFIEKHTLKSSQSVFTVLEIMLTVAAIAILAGIIVVTTSPDKELAKTMDNERRYDVGAIADAVYQYSVENNGALPTVITDTPVEICISGGASCVNYADLGVLAMRKEYLDAIPNDPAGPNGDGTGYLISKDKNGVIVVAAPRADVVIETKRPQ